MKSKIASEPSPDISTRHQFRPHFAGLILFILAAAIAAMIVWRSEQNRLQIERARIYDIAGDHAHAMQANIERALSATYSLAAMVRQGKGNIYNFEDTASEMLPFYPGAASLQLAPNGVVSRIVPLEGNKEAIGHDLLKDPARTKEAFQARNSGKLTLAGPFNLKQGGIGAVGRLPVFLDDGTGQSSFWGFTIVLIRFPEALVPAHLSNLGKRGFQYELWRTHPDTGKKQVIAASSPTPLIKPVNRQLELPNGTWTLSVVPSDGWDDPGGLASKAALGLFFSLLLYVLVCSLLNTRAKALQIAKKLTSELKTLNEQLEQRVQERTTELSERNAELQHAMEEIKTLKGILPICMYCKKIRDDSGYWNQLEVYIHDHSDADFSHGICPDCLKECLAEIEQINPKKTNNRVE